MFQPEIYSLLLNNSFDPESVSEVIGSDSDEVIGNNSETVGSVEWCQTKQNLQKTWSAAVAEACQIAAAVDGEDQRPHLWDESLGQYLLVDSGSCVTAWPPDPGDRPDPSRVLRAVNGTKLKCYGTKEVIVKIGRKPFKFTAVKADVASPIIGWDFIRKHRLSFVWNKWGDILIKDRKSNIKKELVFKPLPQLQSDSMSSLRTHEAQSDDVNEVFKLVQEVAAMQSVDLPADTNEPDIFMSDQSLDLLADSPFKSLLSRFPGLLTQDFTKDTSKTGVIHRIDTGSATPTRAKIRPIPASSPKAVKGAQAWQELIRLGIVEKVNPGDPNNWTNPLHFTWKADGSIRPVGDYRQLNQKTVLDLYPLKHIKQFTHDIAGSVIFSKVDLFKAFHQIIIDPRDRHKTCVTTPWGLSSQTFLH